MTKKYTPGPWVIPLNNSRLVCTDKGKIVSRALLVNGGQGEKTEAEAEANARLISCAPELLEALEAAMDYINNCPCDPDIYPEQWAAWEKLSDIQPMNLIKKAKGE